jgi:hypothetical protein
MSTNILWIHVYEWINKIIIVANNKKWIKDKNICEYIDIV